MAQRISVPPHRPNPLRKRVDDRLPRMIGYVGKVEAEAGKGEIEEPDQFAGREQLHIPASEQQ